MALCKAGKLVLLWHTRLVSQSSDHHLTIYSSRGLNRQVGIKRFECRIVYK